MLTNLTDEQRQELQERIDAMECERDDFIQEVVEKANTQVAVANARIAALKELLEETQEDDNGTDH